MTPARANRPPAQEGFILIEVLVSAVILAIVAGAVLTLLSATTRSAAAERTHSEAYGLAQEDQARLRSMRISSLNRLEQQRPPIELDGTTYTVHSQGLFVSNSTGSESCNSGSSPADYVRITSTVSSPAMRSPVVIQSIVSPSNGSLDPSHGTLSFGAANATGKPLSGVSISGTGTSNFSGSTDSTGCANFADLPSGNYTVTTSAGGMINPKGETSTSQVVGVPSSGTQLVSLLYDRAGSLEVEFDYRVGSSGTFLPANADSIEVYNGEGGTTATAYGTPGGTRTPTVRAPSLFPFKNKDTVYAGSCETNNPDPKEEKPGNRVAMTFPFIPSGNAVSPRPVIQLPALNLTVTYNGSVVSGARVTITDVNSNCKFNGSSVKRVYTTNKEGKQSTGAEGLAEPGLPWGQYKICASAKVKTTETRRIESTTTAVENLTSGTSLSLSLSGTGSSSGSACP